MAGEEDLMNDTEEAVRHLFAVATEDIPPGIDLLRDQQGRVRQLDADYSIGKTERKVEMTFGGFGFSVSVSAPPASEVFVPQPHGGTVGFGLKPRHE
jgi:hypothetical protein